MTGHSRHTANAFASTFYFFADTQINLKKIKRACKPTHGGQCKLDTTDLRKYSRAAHNKVLPKAGLTCFYGTFVLRQTAVLLLNFCAKIPRLRQYPNRYGH
jgi:hypothetical protein